MENKKQKPLKVWKQGPSLVVTIPKKFAEKLGIKPGDFLLPKIEGDKLVYKKVEF